MVLNLGLVLEKFSGRSTVPEYSWKFEIRAGSNRLYSRFDPVLQNSGFLVHSKFSDFRSELFQIWARGMAVYHQDGPNFCRIHAWASELSARAQVRIRGTGSKPYGVRYPVSMKYRSYLKRAPISLNHQYYQAWLSCRSDCIESCRLRAVVTVDQYIGCTT